MKIIKGDILDIENGILCHQVNCQGVMGAGLALQIMKKYPKVFVDYEHQCDLITKTNGRKALLGSMHATVVNPDLAIANCFGQFNYSTSHYDIVTYTDYPALENALLQVIVMSRVTGAEIYVPYKMGCGLARGDWEIIQDLLFKLEDEQDIEFNIVRRERGI